MYRNVLEECACNAFSESNRNAIGSTHFSQSVPCSGNDGFYNYKFVVHKTILTNRFLDKNT